MPPKLGLIAGGGQLPARLIAAAHAAGREVFVVGLEGHVDVSTISSTPHRIIRLGALGDILETLKLEGVTDLVLAGGVRRPSLAELRPDWRAAKFLARSAFLALGDDGLLKAIRGELEAEGFTIIAPPELLHELRVAPGPLTSRVPDEAALEDINRAVSLLISLAPHDVGQAAVVQQGLVLGIEAIEGTAALLARAKDLAREGRGGVLVKIVKPGQDKALDLPLIGPETIAEAAAAGLCGIAIEANGVLVLDRASTIAKAEAAGIFLYALELHMP